MKNLLVFCSVILFAGLMISCNNSDDFCFDKPEYLSSSANQKSEPLHSYANEPYKLTLDIYGDKYKTFIILDGQSQLPSAKLRYYFVKDEKWRSKIQF